MLDQCELLLSVMTIDELDAVYKRLLAMRAPDTLGRLIHAVAAEIAERHK